MAINNFSQYLTEEENSVYFTFGRMNPPTVGHGKLLDRMSSLAGKDPYRVFLSQSADPKKNPLDYTTKVKHVRKMFPKHARQVLINKNVKTAMEALVALYSDGFRNVVMVVGQDRVREFDILINKYNGQKSRHGFYNFQSIKVISAGDRDPDSDDASGASATKQRQAAYDNNYSLFDQGVPKTMSNSDARKLFNDVRRGMGLKEEKSFKHHVQLEPVSNLREDYVNKTLFELGETVIISKTGAVGSIDYLGSNYVIVEANSERFRCWLDDVSKLDEAASDSWYKDQPEWGTPEAVKKAKSVTPGEFDEGSEGLWHNIHKKRKEGRPMRKPGSDGAPTKQDFKNAAEAIDHIAKAQDIINTDKAQASDMIAKEKEKDAKKHKRILAAARRAMAAKKNKGTT